MIAASAISRLESHLARNNNHIRPEEKLDVLREADSHRKWYSLDDRRVCVQCDRVISGRMVDVWQDSRGMYHLYCPTAGCSGSPRDWFYHGVSAERPVKVQRSRAPVIGFGLSAA